jgi:hypothetical protein
MANFQDKSLEELRAEDYAKGNKGGEHLQFLIAAHTCLRLNNNVLSQVLLRGERTVPQRPSAALHLRSVPLLRAACSALLLQRHSGLLLLQLRHLLSDLRHLHLHLVLLQHLRLAPQLQLSAQQHRQQRHFRSAVHQHQLHLRLGLQPQHQHHSALVGVHRHQRSAQHRHQRSALRRRLSAPLHQRSAQHRRQHSALRHLRLGLQPQHQHHSASTRHQQCLRLVLHQHLQHLEQQQLRLSARQPQLLVLQQLQPLHSTQGQLEGEQANST